MTADPVSNPTLAEDPGPRSSIRSARTLDSSAASADGYAIGQILDGKYRVERKLGEGAMGVVLAATHLGLDELVAIKFMRPEVQNTAGTAERFAREAKIAARIRSEHVAKVLDVGTLPPLGPCIVMEYLEGQSLEDLLETQREPLSSGRVVEYVLQACEALAAAHAVGVIHRDVKPDNLFVTHHGGLETLKLLDFGISKAALTGGVLGDDAASRTSSFVMGTPLYMSPEQLRSSPDVDCRTDIWSIGAVMYELLSGAAPFQGQSIAEICAAILDVEPAPLAAACPDALGAIVLRCLEKDPERRFQTVADLAAALTPFAPGEALAYASRSSSILRTSMLDLKVDPALFAAVPGPARSSGFQGSALVAAATVLALAAIGVAITVSRPQTRDAALAQPVHAVPAPTVPSPVVSPVPVPVPVPVPKLVVYSESAVPSGAVAPPADVTVREPPAPAPAVTVGETPVKVRAKSPRAVSTPSRHVASAPSERTNGAVAVDEAPRLEAPRTGRVRLVEPRVRLRLVDGQSAGAERARGTK